MGPDCGTAVVGGVGLGFANVVRPGPVGLVAASGTGAQQVMSLLAAAGVGISHCLGVGGRDLSDVVGGVSTRAALDALDADPATELIVVLGKPPAPQVADEVRAHAARLHDAGGVRAARSGRARPHRDRGERARPGSASRCPTGRPGRLRRRHRGRRRWLRGLFSGGTLCVEAMAVAAAIARSDPVQRAPSVQSGRCVRTGGT